MDGQGFGGSSSADNESSCTDQTYYHDDREHLDTLEPDWRSPAPSSSSHAQLMKKHQSRQQNTAFHSPMASISTAGGVYEHPGKSQGVLRRNKWINRQVTRIADTGDLQKLLQTIQYYISEMNGINLVTALHRVTKLVASSAETTAQLLRQPGFQLLRSTVVQHIDMHKANVDMERGSRSHEQPFLEVQCLSIVCWSCATLRLRDERLLDKVTEIVMPCLHEFKAFELANMLWALAKLALGKRPLFCAASDKVLNRQDGEFSLQCLSMIAWSFATEKHRDPAMFASMAVEIALNASFSKPQEIANTLWAYAKNHCAELQLFRTLADTAVSSGMLRSFNPQELSNTVWAFATISLKHESLFSNVVPVAINKRHELAPQNIANILWAYARFQACPGSGLFPALLQVSVANLPIHKPYEISAIVWAAAKENDPSCCHFFETIAHMCGQRLHEFPPQALSNMVEAFAVVQANTPAFQDAMDRESISRLHQFSPNALQGLFQGVVLRTVAVSEDADIEGDWPTLSAVGTQIAMRVTELQRSELEHVQRSLQRLDASVCERVLTWLRQVIATEIKTRDDQSTQSNEKASDDLSFLGLDCVDDDGAASDCGLFVGNGEHRMRDTKRNRSGKGGGKWNKQASEGGAGSSAGFMLPPGLVPPPRHDGGARPNLTRSVMPDMIGTNASDEPWSQNWNSWNPIEQEQPSSNSISGGYSRNGFANASFDPSWSVRSSGAASIWSDPRASAAPAYVSSELVAKGPPLSPMATNLGNGFTSAARHSRSTMSAQAPGSPWSSQVSPMWKPFAVDVSCLVHPVQDALGSPSWQVVDFNEYIYASLIGTGSSILRLRFGVVDERVVMKRIADSKSISWPATLANSPHMLSPLALVAAPDGHNHYAAYIHCQQGSLGEWIVAKSSSSQTLTNIDIARIMIGIVKAAGLLISFGIDVGALCIDDIFIDNCLEPRVRLRHEQFSRSLPLSSAAKWFSPEEAEAISPQFPCYSSWPAASYRIGLLLYCIRAGLTDPYPSKHVDLVVLDLRREKLGQCPPVRPDMSRVDDQHLHTIMISCLDSNPAERPGQDKLSELLANIAAEGPPE